MNKVLHEFLNLRRAGRAGTGENVVAADMAADGITKSGQGAKEPVAVVPKILETVPDLEVAERELMAYFIQLLAAHHAGRIVHDRTGLAGYLAKGVLEKYGDPWTFTTVPSVSALDQRNLEGRQNDRHLRSDLGRWESLGRGPSHRHGRRCRRWRPNSRSRPSPETTTYNEASILAETRQGQCEGSSACSVDSSWWTQFSLPTRLGRCQRLDRYYNACHANVVRYASGHPGQNEGKPPA